MNMSHIVITEGEKSNLFSFTPYKKELFVNYFDSIPFLIILQ